LFDLPFLPLALRPSRAEPLAMLNDDAAETAVRCQLSSLVLLPLRPCKDVYHSGLRQRHASEE
jgi:hypothetical protein